VFARASENFWAHLSRLECLESKRGVGTGLGGNEDSVEPLVLEERILVIVDPDSVSTSAVSFRNKALTTCVRVGASSPTRRSRREDRRLRRALLAARRMQPVLRSALALCALPAPQASEQRPPTFRACLWPIRPRPITPMRRRRDSGRAAEFVGTATGILTFGVWCGVFG
jgi:hypothetical protein